jgi:hypothetical protein
VRRRRAQLVLLVVATLFIVGVGIATADDISRNGEVTPIDVVSMIVLAFLAITLLGSLRPPPRR